MSNHDLLDVIGQAQDPYILSALRTRRRSDLPVSRHSGLRRRLLIAAAVIAALLLTACAAKYARELLAVYFLDDGRQSLNDSQLEYIQSNTQPTIGAPVSSQPQDGFSVQVRSALTDGRIAYITIDIRAPEGVSLEGSQIRFHENPLLIPEQTDGLIIAPDGSSPDAMCDYETIDDGDGLANTVSIVFKVNPATENNAVTPFDGSIRWRLQGGGFRTSVFDSEAMTITDTPMTELTWAYDLTFQQMETREVEFVSEPIAVMTSYWPGNDFVNENQILSFTLSDLSRHMELAEPTIDGEMQNIGDVSIVMKDGTQMTLLRLTAGTSSLSTPIILEEVDYILLTNGVRLYPPA